MTSDGLGAAMREPIFTGLNHICVVTSDIERAVRVWSDKYGIGPWNLYTFDASASNMSARIHGRPVDFVMRVGLCRISPTFRVEIIQPLDERSLYAASLAHHKGVDHIHHVRVEVEEYGGAISRLDELRLDKPMEASFCGAPGVEGRFTGTYFSTETDLGFILEVGHAPDGFQMGPPEFVYP
jgi:methylmalonyl-CoA/ethylmalonyl-CoA epimerase